MRGEAQSWLQRGLALSAVFACASMACLRPTEERVRQDLQVGQAALPELEVEVEDGHAAVRELEPRRVRLWASAPRFNVTLTWAAAPRELALEVQNCMPRAVAEVRQGRGTALPLGRSSSGVCQFTVTPLSAELSLTIAPQGSDGVGAFRFAVLSDVQEALPEVQDIYRVLNRQEGIDFVLGAGDLTERGSAPQLERFQRELEQLTIPYYTTLGNHELGQTPTLYHSYFGRGSQSFEYKGVRFTLLDSASATLDPIVYAWLESWLARGASQAHVVAMHIPPLDPVGVRNGAFASRNEAAKLLARLAAGKVDLTLYGHIHSYYHFENAGIRAHVSGGGGAIPERFDDLGRHFLVVEVEPASQRFDVSVVRVD